MYLAVKHIHLTMVSLSLFTLFSKGLLDLYLSTDDAKTWVKVVPHLIDTLLLVSAITLCVLIQQYPGVHGWVTAKVIALVAYIVLGTIALKRGKTKAIKATAMLLALMTFAYIGMVAVSHSPTPWAA